MASSSDQIQAEIARTRADMTARLDNIQPSGEGFSVNSVTSSLSGITEQVRRHPLTALGLSLAAGSLLQGAMSGGRSGGSSYSGPSTGGSVSGTLSQTGSSVSQGMSSATDRATQTAQSARDTVAGAASQVADTASSTASQVADAASSAASTVSDTASGAASQVAATTTDVAQQVAGTTADVVNRAADTASSAASTVSDQVSSVSSSISRSMGDLGGTISYQIQTQPLAALSVATVAGVLAQPVLAPQVSKFSQSVGQTATKVQSSLSSTAAASAPNQGEIDRIRQAFVPAAVGRVKQFASRDLRDYLDTNLQPVVGQTSLRAGVVAAVTEKAEAFAESRLPSLLDRTLTGTRGLILTAVL
ncbi:MAG: hypothetical protein M3P51_02285, partial [Chloroflexota bacterium]|nr:hypothetical protein [Chloroflexota bacterium]